MQAHTASLSYPTCTYFFNVGASNIMKTLCRGKGLSSPYPISLLTSATNWFSSSDWIFSLRIPSKISVLVTPQHVLRKAWHSTRMRRAPRRVSWGIIRIVSYKDSTRSEPLLIWGALPSLAATSPWAPCSSDWFSSLVFLCCLAVYPGCAVEGLSLGQ
jgi:hypothetical protein